MRTLGTLGLGLLMGLSSMATLVAQQTAAQSSAAAKEVADLMAKANKDCVAMEHPSVFGGYVAALSIPGAKLTVVTARFKDTTAMTYKLYQKDCMGAYADLNAAVDAMDRVIIDDINADGLVATPKKDTPLDGITREGKTEKFDGDKNALKKLKMTPEDFAKSFTSADDLYTQLLRLLSVELKK